MKTKAISALLVTLMFSIASIKAAGLLNENDLLISSGANAHKKGSCAVRPVPATPKAKSTNSAKATDEVTVKLFNARGELLGLQQVPMQEFLASTFPEKCLPSGSTFVMYHGHTDYYQLPGNAVAMIN